MRRLGSLRNAVLLFVLLPLLGILVAVGMLGLREIEGQMMRRLQDDIELVARSIRLPIAAAMVRSDTDAVREALDSIFQIVRCLAPTSTIALVSASRPVDRTAPCWSAGAMRARSPPKAPKAVLTSAAVVRCSRSSYPCSMTLGRWLGCCRSRVISPVSKTIWPAYAGSGASRWVCSRWSSCLWSWWGHHRAVGRHVRAFMGAMEPIGTGQSGLRVPQRGPDELRRLGASINAMIGRWEASEQRLRDQRAREARLERELRQSEKLAAIGRLAAGLAHELGTPLGSVAGCAQRAARHLPAEAPAQAELAQLLVELGRVEEILRELLDFARRGVLNRREVELAPLIQGVVARSRQASARHDLQVEIELPDSLAELRLEVDPLRVEQALGNLLDNALQAAARRVRLSAELAEEQLHLQVEDDGPGVASEAIERLFEPFFTTKPVGQGTGLGLAVAGAAIAEHGGRLWLASACQQGACFQMTLPLTRNPEATAEPRGADDVC